MCASGQTSNSLPESVLAKFRAAHPDYESTRLLDEWRDTEYSRLDRSGHFFHDPAGMSFDVLRERIRREYGLEVGAIRVSVGIASNLADAEAFLAFAARFRDRTISEIGSAASPGACALPTREGS